ncbi:signal transduction histidine kinase [Azorhizobium oxalatiphilum]|uniref:histidine kinase n=1 Tax=Azorhizobium oxalatiphilum TaxID=980631 RepID=A0A917FM94_9HYPH|nr:AAA family ATPase [Azorhizobium oxalatiphilum]GGF89458.1 signal transduction histidine kinase [Azorhizobium oxalatiphilum]
MRLGVSALSLALNAMPEYSAYSLEPLTVEAEFALCIGRAQGKPAVLARVTRGGDAGSRAALAREFSFARLIDADWAARPLALSRYDNGEMLVIEDRSTKPLDFILAEMETLPFNLRARLALAIALVRAVRGMHAAGVVHSHIRTGFFLVDGDGRIRITGFDAASLSKANTGGKSLTDVSIEDLPYLAPEQSGRTNHSVDMRTDLYSMGVVLYFLFARRLPFTTADAGGLMHSHVARTPTAPSVFEADLPKVIDEIILKLLEKDPDRRYQSAAGVGHDISQCLSLLEEHGSVEALRIGLFDASDRLRTAGKLFGRQEDLGRLMEEFRGTSEGRGSAAAFISGEAGIGKSALVDAFRECLPRTCMFAAGKFDQYKRDIPYATLAQALRGTFRALLAKGEVELVRWRADLSSALGVHAQLMVELVPELALLLGELPRAPVVEPQSSQSRFHAVFIALLGVLAQSDHPLVLFIDDLQWLDAGTLALLERILSDPGLRYLMVIGAYRADEVDSAHPLTATIDSVSRLRGELTEISLSPLGKDALSAFVASILQVNAEVTLPLAEVLIDKTAGNPFFVAQYVTALAEQRLLAFEVDTGTWAWDIEGIRALPTAENVADFLAAKLRRLDAQTRSALFHLACLGNGDTTESLADILGRSTDEVNATLCDAVDGGFVIRSDEVLRFAHDRVQEASYALFPEPDRAAAHMRIAKALYARRGNDAFDDRLFEVVNQFTRGLSALEQPSDRVMIAGLCFAAGKRAREASAFQSAQHFLAMGSGLLPGWGEEAQFDLMFGIELLRSECEIVNGEFGAANGRLSVLASAARAVETRAQVVCLQLLMHFTTGGIERAVQVALAFFESVGVPWSSHPTEADVRREYQVLRSILGDRTADDLLKLPAMTDRTCMAMMSVLTEVFPAAYAFDRCLLELVLLRMTNLSLQFGNHESSSVAYSALNMALGTRFADYETAVMFGSVARSLVEDHGNNRHRSRVYSCIAAFTMPWTLPLPQCEPLMREASRVGRSMGDMAFAAYNARNLITHLLVSGETLEAVKREAEDTLASAQHLQLGVPTERFVQHLALIETLQDNAITRSSNEARARQPVDLPPGAAMMECYYRVFRLQEHYFLGEFGAAVAVANHIEPARWAMRSSIEESEYEFYTSLALAAMLRGEAQHSDLLHDLRLHHGRIAAWARGCPENFSAREALVRAEIDGIEGRISAAQDAYEQAVQLAAAQGITQVEALASELAGEFYDRRGLKTLAEAYLAKAIQCYARWGAQLRVRRLETRFPSLRLVGEPARKPFHQSSSLSRLDVEAVGRASLVLSGEMVLPNLLEKLMRLAVEHSGAQRGILVLMREGVPHVEARAATADGPIEVQVASSRLTGSDLPLSVFNYVLRTGERILLNDAVSSGLSAEDDYVVGWATRSVICLPIRSECGVAGVLYLENNLSTRAFSVDVAALLEFLASQTPIWLENARLYSDLQRSEAWLREAQRVSLTGSFFWRVNSEEVEFSEQTFRAYDVDPHKVVTLEILGSRFHPEDLPQFQRMLEAARRGEGDIDFMHRACMADGAIKYLHVVAHGSRSNGGDLIYTGTVQDVTQRQAAEAALGKVRSELAYVSRATSLGVLTASIAHEVNQPLSGIVNNASACLSMLSANPPNIEGARRTAERSRRDGHRAADVIKRLRALFGSRALSHERVNINEAVDEVLALSAAELQHSKVVVRRVLMDHIPDVIGDRVQLQQVMLNLILNASDAMREVSDRQRLIIVHTALDKDSCVRLAVRDSGNGIDHCDRERIFEAFYTTRTGGMGMGLSISRYILESHAGRLWVEPTEERGATFVFAIPSASSPKAEKGRGRAPEHGQSRDWSDVLAGNAK